MGEPQVLIVAGDRQTCRLLTTTFASWGIMSKYIHNPSMVPNETMRNFYNLILLDIIMPVTSGANMVAEIAEMSPDTKIIVMSGSTKKESVIRSLGLEVFDFLERPFSMDLLFDTVKRALDTQKIEIEHKRAIEQIKSSHNDILSQTLQIEILSRQLMEANKALSLLLENIEKRRKEREEEAFLKMRSIIISMIEGIKQDGYMRKYQPQLIMLDGYIEDLTSGLVMDLQGTTSLSLSEVRIAFMIKHGMASEDIARLLHVSPDTVKTHRRNIRRKLHIKGAKKNLGTYLRSITQQAAEAEPNGDA